MTLTRRTPVVSSVDSERGFGVGRFDCGPYGVGEEEITIEIDSTTAMDARQFAWQLLDHWEAYFRRHAVAI
jgi:hypothetical protein